MSSFDDNRWQQGSGFRFARPALWEFFKKNKRHIFGVKTARTKRILKRAQAFTSYAIMVKNNGAVEIVQNASGGEGPNGNWVPDDFGIFFFSAIGFNASRDSAFLYASFEEDRLAIGFNSSGQFDYPLFAARYGSYYYLQKTNDKWRVINVARDFPIF
jgi:hypothetical protein